MPILDHLSEHLRQKKVKSKKMMKHLCTVGRIVKLSSKMNLGLPSGLIP